MAEQQTIKYVPRWNNMTVDNVTFQTNNVVGLSKLGSDYTQDENFRFLPGILSNSNFTKDPSKVTDIELTAHMFVENSQKDSVSPRPLSAKPKKVKSQTVTLTLPKSQGPQVPGALSKKSKRPKFKKPPTEIKVTPPKLTEHYEQSHSVSWTPYLIPKGPATHPKDSGGNIQPFDRDLTSTTSNEGTAKTTSHPEGLLRDKDSGGHIPPTDMEPIHPTVADLSDTSAKYEAASIAETYHQSPPPQADKPQSSHAPSTEASDTDSSCNNILNKYNNILPLSECQLVKYLRKDNSVINKKISEATESFTKFSTNITDLQSSMNTLQAHALKQDEELAAWAKSSTNMAWNLGSRLSGQSLGSVTPTLALTHILANVERENATNTTTEEPPSHTERD
ncbi:hypothetical protein Tco_1249750, partial [Tanacetum coccineum]